MKQKHILFLFFVCLLSLPALAYGQTISGVVTDAVDGEPLSGVNIIAEGTTTGTVTTLDGDYQITVSDNVTHLVFSFLGYQTRRIAIQGRTTINVQMQSDLLLLDDLVVTALGLDADQRSLGYAIQSVRGQQIADTRQISVSDALSGQFSGVLVTSQAGVPGGATSVNIRGRASLLGNNQPLYVVDGVPISNDYNTTVVFSSVDNSNRAIDINPEDVESMTVLKGPAAAALYGIDAANGAIIIETKRGAQGSVPRTNINLTSRVGLSQVNKLYNMQREYGPGTNGNLGLTSPAHWGPHISELSYDGNTASNWHIRGNPVLRSDPAATGEAVETYDNMDAFFESGLSTSNQISISTGTRDRSLFFSFGNTDENGFIPKTYFKRNSVRLNADSDLTNRLRVSGRANYINSQGRRAGRGSNFTSMMIPLTRTNPIMDITFGTSDPKNDPFAYENPDGSARTHQGRSATEGGASRGPDSPFWTVNNNIYRDEVSRFVGNAMLSYDLASWAVASYRFGLDTYSDRRRHNFDLGSSGGDGRLGRLFEETFTTRNYHSDLLLTLTHSMDNDWNFQLVTGHNYQNYVTHRMYVSARGFEQRGFFNIANTTQDPIVQHSTLPRERVAVFGNLNINYRDLVYVDLTGRNEWSSTLPADNNSFFFPAISGAFIFSEAFEMPDVISFGQLRASYASVGNDAPLFITNSYFIPSSVGQSYGNSFIFPYQGVLGTAASVVVGNPNIEPETNTSLEFGGDIRFFENRLRLDVTWYISNNKNQIIPVSLPPSSGYNLFQSNAGELENRGVEVQVNVTPFMGNDFRWDATLNFSRNRSEVIALADGVDMIELGGLGPPGVGINPRLVPGEAYGVFYGTGWLRDANGNKIIDSNPNNATYGYPMRNPELMKLGDPNPDFTLGIRNTFNYRAIRFTSLIDIRQGGDVWNGVEAIMRQNGQSRETERRGETVIFDGVKEDGSPNDIPVELNQFYWQNIEGYSNVNEPFVEDASWIRLRDVTLSYALSPAFTNRIGLSSATVSLWGRNLLLITGYSGIDPETNLYGPDRSIGIDYYNNPSARSFGVEINLAL